MTLIKIHGILAREYGSSFKFELPNPKNVLEAIDCNKQGFIKRLIELQKQGFCYDIIINKKRVTQEEHISGVKNPKTIDLVPAIAGAGPAFFLPLVGGSALLANIASALFFAVIAYALTPKPEVEALEIEAALIYQYSDKITNHQKRSKVSKTLINQANRYINKVFPKLNENYIDLKEKYPGIKAKKA